MAEGWCPAGEQGIFKSLPRLALWVALTSNRSALRFHFLDSVFLLLVGLAGIAGCTKKEASPRDRSFTVGTFAGSGAVGALDGPAAAATFGFPGGVAVDAQGAVYVADQANHCVRKVTAAGLVSTLAGTGTRGFADGPGSTAQFNSPMGVAVDAQGTVYVADRLNHRIRAVSPLGVVRTLAGMAGTGLQDGASASARFLFPSGVAVGATGAVYVADAFNHRIRVVSPQGVVSTLAGSGPSGNVPADHHADGPGSSALFSNPQAVAVDGQGNVYVADTDNHRIRKITAAGVVTTVAGSATPGRADGVGSTALFDKPKGVAVDAAGTVYVTDLYNSRICRISPAGEVSTWSGAAGTTGFVDGGLQDAKFFNPIGIAATPAGTQVYIGDNVNHRIRQIKAN